MPRHYALNYECIVCGAPVGRSNSRCPEHSATHRRERMKSYLKAHHATHRPSPQPLPQDGRGDLPPIGTLIDDGDRVQCHVCGRWFGSLVTHIRIHGHDADSYKAAYGLARTTSLFGPTCAAKQRQAAIDRDQSSKGIRFGEHADPVSRPRGLDNRLESRVRMSDADRARKPAGRPKTTD